MFDCTSMRIRPNAVGQHLLSNIFDARSNDIQHDVQHERQKMLVQPFLT